MPTTTQNIKQQQLTGLPDYLDWCDGKCEPKDVINQISQYDMPRSVNYAMLRVLSKYQWMNPDFNNHGAIWNKWYYQLPKILQNQLLNLKHNQNSRFYFEQGLDSIFNWYESFNPTIDDKNAVISVAIMFNYIRPEIWAKWIEKELSDKDFKLRFDFHLDALTIFDAQIKTHWFYHRIAPNEAIAMVYPTKIDTGLTDATFIEDYGFWKWQKYPNDY